MYYVMDYDTDQPGAGIMPLPVIPGHEKLYFDLGTRIDADIPVFDFKMDEESQGPLLDYVWATFRGTILSSGFKSVLDQVGIDNIDYYPVRIVNEITDEIARDYYAANIIGVISCMDKEKSKYTVFPAIPDKISSIEELHLDYAKIHNERIFRLSERIVLILVDESVKAAVTRAELKGAKFVPAENYNTWE
jgi:hypothetical protein